MSYHLLFMISCKDHIISSSLVLSVRDVIFGLGWMFDISSTVMRLNKSSMVCVVVAVTVDLAEVTEDCLCVFAWLSFTCR